ncbi:MAG: endolytic transglycosylase MltG [Acidobacteriota bacterium]
MLDRFEHDGILMDATLARLYLVYRLGDPPLQAGEYRFETPLSTPEVLGRLIDGRVVRHPVTIVEGLTIFETAAALALAGFGDQDVFTDLVQSPRLIEDIDAEAPNLEGYLFPDTYAFAKGTSEDEIVAAIVANFKRRYETEVAPLLAADEERTTRDLVTLASIVEKEAKLDDERAVIAGVYANRLKRGIALYADPTIIYGLKLLGQWDGNLRRDDLKLDSPYNTYIYPGLTPGPIASPGLASLKAAADPADVPYLYFVSRNDGSHVFAETLSEHNRNVNKWQKRYWRKRWADEQAGKSDDQR